MESKICKMHSEKRQHKDRKEKIVVRKGLFRQAGEAAIKYADATANREPNAKCVFCPPLAQELLPDAPKGFSVFDASSGYDCWDGHKVERHLLVTPDEHVSELHLLGRKALYRLHDYLYDLRQSAPDDIAVQDYARISDNPSKSQPHYHTNLFFMKKWEMVSELHYTADKGLTTLKFTRPTMSQIRDLNAKK